MITPRPLSTEELKEMHRKYAEGGLTPEFALIDQLVAAEAYWRETVKNIEQDSFCMFCDPQRLRSATNVKHTPDCPWLLAQDL